MMKLSNFKSSSDHITFNIEVDASSILKTLPKNVETDSLKGLFTNFVKELTALQVIVSHAGTPEGSYRQERETGISRLRNAYLELFDRIKDYKKALKASLNDKVIQDELVACEDTIASLSDLKHEYEKLSGMRTRVAAITKLAHENFQDKIRFYKAFNTLIKGEIKAGLTLEGEDDYSFEIYDLSFQEAFDDGAEMARYKEFLTLEIGIHIDKMIQDLVDKKRVLKRLMVDKFNPWTGFEDVTPVAEFLKARAEVANFWNEEFSFTENLAHHYFKCQGFYKFFEENLLVRLNEVKDKIDKKVMQIQNQYEIKENILSLYGHLTVSEFMKGGNLRLVSTEGIPKPRHHSYNALKLANDKLAKVIWAAAEQNIAKKLGGKVVAPGVIVRPNKRDNNIAMKTELIVLSNPSRNEDPKIILNGKYRDLIATKSEDMTELFEIKHSPEGISVDLDLKLSYFLSTSKIAA